LQVALENSADEDDRKFAKMIDDLNLHSCAGRMKCAEKCHYGYPKKPVVGQMCTPTFDGKEIDGVAPRRFGSLTEKGRFMEPRSEGDERVVSTARRVQEFLQGHCNLERITINRMMEYLVKYSTKPVVMVAMGELQKDYGVRLYVNRRMVCDQEAILFLTGGSYVTHWPQQPIQINTSLEKKRHRRMKSKKAMAKLRDEDPLSTDYLYNGAWENYLRRSVHVAVQKLTFYDFCRGFYRVYSYCKSRKFCRFRISYE
jgi:hypothetical protein